MKRTTYERSSCRPLLSICQHHHSASSASSAASASPSSSVLEKQLQLQSFLNNSRHSNHLSRIIHQSVLCIGCWLLMTYRMCHPPHSHSHHVVSAFHVSAPSIQQTRTRTRSRSRKENDSDSTSKSTSSSFVLNAEVSWLGDSYASMEITSTTSSTSVSTLHEWLNLPSASDLALLGTSDATPLIREERVVGTSGAGTNNSISNTSVFFECWQPRLDFLGLDLQPVFINQIDRHQAPSSNNNNDRNCNGTLVVTVSIIEARIEMPTTSKKPNLANRGIRRIMERAQMNGRSVITAVPMSSPNTNNSTTCPPLFLLSVDLALSLTVVLPPYVPLPPGFNRVGNAIMRRTGTTRSKQLLEDIKRHYQKWQNDEIERSNE